MSRAIALAISLEAIFPHDCMSAVQDLMPGKQSLFSTSRQEIEGVG